MTAVSTSTRLLVAGKSLFHERRLVEWLILLRSIVFLVMLIIVVNQDLFLNSGLHDKHYSNAYSVVSFGFIEVILSSLWYIKGKYPTILLGIQLFVNGALVTSIVYFSGCSHSPFLVLYLPLVMIVSFFSSRKKGLLFSFFLATSYALLHYFLQNDVLRYWDGSDGSAQTDLALHVTGLLSGMILVSVAISFLKKRMLLGVEGLTKSQASLDALKSLHDDLLEEISQGLWVVDSSGYIVRFNSKSTIIFGEKGILNRKFYQVLHEVSENYHEIKGDWQTCELKISDKIISCQRIQNQNTSHGRFILFEDITNLRVAQKLIADQERMVELLTEQSVDPTSDRREIDSIGQFIKGTTPLINELKLLIQKVAQSDSTVLIQGESGTGKELVAHAIHSLSARSINKFVAINCGAIPEHLIEGELFGHVKGAFTGAVSSHLGLFRSAERGTLFLDEIGELPLHMQVKLLRALEERKVRPLGSDRDFEIDVRIIAATHKDLLQEVAHGNFREDLFYRLNVINFVIPPLRDRREDIPELISFFLKCNFPEGTTPVISPEALAMLVSYDYPGNVRELRNVIERACVFGGLAVSANQLPEHIQQFKYSFKPSSTVIITDTSDQEITLPCNLEDILSKIELVYLKQALLKSGSKKETAELLGINVRSLRYRLQKHSIVLPNRM
jgi:transcriptional regulator with PAS, ATPase and Fis domain